MDYRTQMTKRQYNRCRTWLLKGTKTIRWIADKVDVGYYQVRYMRRKLRANGEL